MDDIYHQLVFDGQTAPHLLRVHDEGHRATRRLIVVNGVSKLYAHDRLPHRLGVGEPRSSSTAMTNVQAQTDLRAASPCCSAAAEGALLGRAERRRGAAADAREQPQRHDARAAVVQRREDVTSPTGTFYCLPDFRAYSKRLGRSSPSFLLKKVRGRDRARARSSAWRATCA
ncbi:MAG: hypothetical protein MZW92_32420 [Comamonadaceae bacterium]|nr:hypothetical protein [Comamonadaceae bacterium]